MGPGDLTKVLAPLPVISDSRLIVGRDTLDDAGVFVVSDDLALVQTVDFFAPIVDDPYHFGRIAATNALSDVYAMGGEPMTAMNIVGFPVGKLPLEVLTEILRGGQDAVTAAGALLVGGHSVTDDEVKYGLSVTGRVHPKAVLTNAAAQPGDALVLTKPLGTGIIATAGKKGTASAAELEAMITSMETLNQHAARVAVALGLRCATDVTGFGFLGHASHIARASNVALHIAPANIPLLPGTRAHWLAGSRTGGAERNLAFVEPLTQWGGTDEAMRGILTDPQTSGGLLLAVPEACVAEYLARVPGAEWVGTVGASGAPALVLR
jgi:selenide,water dikinase